MPDRLVLDVSSLAYRAWFALPASISDSAGRPVNAVHGYLDMTARLIADRSPDEVVHALDDDWRPAPRVARWPGYKAHREPDPPDVARQLAIIAEIAAVAGGTVVRAPGWEADDAIAVLCAQAAPGDRVAVVSGDRDLVQLVRDGRPQVQLLFTVRGVTQLEAIDETGCRSRFGVPPGRYADLAALRGDPSDGVPGLPGVGARTAARLVEAYSSLAALVDDASAQPPRLAAVLSERGEELAAMREVLALRGDVAIERRAEVRDDARLQALAAEHAVTGPVGRLRAAMDRAME